ncbi:MAG: signal peptidase I [bacterium]|nr:signal peptidase I [bacterium]
MSSPSDPNGDHPDIPAPKKKKKQKSSFREYTEALLVAVLIALFLRAFIVEAFKIPSGSMIPTLVVGDHIFVNKFVYGIRIPLTKKWLAKWKNPERGETIVFIYPENPKLDFIKRVVGVPGDRIRINGDDIFVNGEKVRTHPVQVLGPNPTNADQLKLNPVTDFPEGSDFKTIPSYPHWQDYEVFLEHLGEHTHLKQEGSFDFVRNREIAVPEGMLFVMGDNRDNSKDSREWGFVPLENVKGRAMFVWLSLRHDARGKITGIRWDRFGKSIP